MKFSDIFNTYITENNLKVETETNIKSSLYSEAFLLEAKKAKAEIYKDLTIGGGDTKITADDVSNVKFYEKGKSVKQGKEGDALNTINTTQAELFNKILQKVKDDAAGNKTTLVELSAAAVKVFRDAGQNTPTANYNLRGVISVLCDKKRILVASKGGEVNMNAITVAPAGEEDTSSAEDIDNVSPEEDIPSSKFDTAISNNNPAEAPVAAEEPQADNYLKVDKGVKVEKEEMQNRDHRISANYILTTIREELPGFYNTESLAAKLQEEDPEAFSGNESQKYIKHLIKMGKITLTSKSSEEDVVPDRDEDSDLETPGISDAPEDIVDRQLSGSTRKGFNFDAFDN